MHRPGVELAIFRSRVRRSNHYTTEPLNEVSALYRVISKYVGFFDDLARIRKKTNALTAGECSEHKDRSMNRLIMPLIHVVVCR